MSKEELKNKCTERAKIFQQAMESCKSSNPMDCIEWFADMILELEKKNEILAKALNLYINWADECGIGWDNFPDMTEKWYKLVEEKELGWIDGLVFMVTEEAKEQLKKEIKENEINL